MRGLLERAGLIPPGQPLEDDVQFETPLDRLRKNIEDGEALNFVVFLVVFFCGLFRVA